MNWAVKAQLTHSREKLEFYSAAKPMHYITNALLATQYALDKIL